MYGGSGYVDSKGNFAQQTVGLNGVIGGGGAGMIAFGTIAGGVSASLTKGNFWQGALSGFAVSMMNHAMHGGFSKKYDVAVFKSKTAANNAGHEAIAFEQENGSFNYVSKDGAEYTVVGEPEMSDINLPSIDDIEKYYYNKSGKSYDEVSIFKATRTQIIEGYNFASKFVNTTYILIGNSCATLVGASMAVTFGTPYKLLFEGSLPRLNYAIRKYTYSNVYSYSQKL